MTQLVELAQPFITAIATALIGLFTTYGMVAIKRLQEKGQASLDAHTNAAQRDMLHKIGQEAFAHAETMWKNYGGEAKLDAAMQYAAQKLRTAGIQLASEEIKAAIHDAWLKYDQAQKAAGVKPTYKATIT